MALLASGLGPGRVSEAIAAKRLLIAAPATADAEGRWAPEASATVLAGAGRATSAEAFEAGVAAETDAATLEVPATVWAGEVVELRWRGIPADIEEMELLLSLDGGRSFHVRLSPELDGHTATFQWLVPDLPSERARLLLRIGDEEKGERVGALSRQFRILHVEGAALPDIAFHEGLMWLGLERMKGPVRSSLDPEAPCLEYASERPAGVLPAPALRAERPDSGTMPVMAAESTSSSASPAPFAAPREVPLRI